MILVLQKCFSEALAMQTDIEILETRENPIIIWI